MLLYDKSPAQIGKSLKFMEKLLDKEVAKGRLTSSEASEARGRVSVVPEEKGIAGLRDVDMAVEVSGITKLSAKY